MLTGKAKQLFEEWATNNGFIYFGYGCQLAIKKIVEDDYAIIPLKELPLSMQFGVYQQWADSMGYYITIECSLSFGPPAFYIFVTWRNKYFIDEFMSNENLGIEPFETRDKAKRAAIEKLNQIINER